MALKALIFDMDGTLIDSAGAIAKTVNELREREFSLPPMSVREIMSIVNDPARNVIYELYGVAGVKGSLRYRFEELFAKNYEALTEPFAPARELLEWARAAGLGLAVATNAPEASTAKILRDCGVAEFFGFVVGVSERVPPKPDPAMLLLAAAHFGCGVGAGAGGVAAGANFAGAGAKCEAVFFGDSLKDCGAAARAGMPYANVLWGKDEIIGEINVRTAGEAIAFCEGLMG